MFESYLVSLWIKDCSSGISSSWYLILVQFSTNMLPEGRNERCLQNATRSSVLWPSQSCGMWALKQYLFLVPTDPSICTTATEACDPQESKEQSCEEKHFCPCGNSTLIATICPWCLGLAWFSALRVGIYGQNCRLHFPEGGNLWPELQTPRPPELSFCRSLRTQFFTTFSWATDLQTSSACVCTRSLQVVPSSLWLDGL